MNMRVSKIILMSIVLVVTGWPTLTMAQAVDERLLDRYTGMMNQLRAELVPQIPKLEDAQAVDTLLASDRLDAKLVTFVVLKEGTPEALAAFAQQGREAEVLIERLLADPGLMKQMLVADSGRRPGIDRPAYGPAMKIYMDIQKRSARASEGILQRLALATALEHAVPIRDHIDPVKRYLHFEKAYLDGELDPDFELLRVWDLRFVVCGTESDEEHAWGREVVRNLRPDHVYTSNRGWRYTRIVSSNVHYGSRRQIYDRPELSGRQNILMNGGICGRRAFFGQFIARAFGIPAIKRPSRAHGAMARWTPGGWVINLGPRWGSGSTTTIYSRDRAFLESSQARRDPEAYLQVKRAMWIGDLMGEKRRYGGPGDRNSWAGLSLLTQERIRKEAKAITLAPLGAEFGAADDETTAERVIASEISEEDKRIDYRRDGTIEIPAAAYSTPEEELSRFTVMKSFAGGLQVYLSPFNRKGVNLLRGGSNTSGPDNCSSGRRIRSARLGSYPNWGFRVAVTPAGRNPPPELTLDLGEGISMEFVYIKPGTFIMGGDREKNVGNFDVAETPKHKVTLTKGYYLGKTEVTCAQFEAVGDKPAAVGSMKTPNHPRGNIDIEAAEWFCERASARTGQNVRLPTEAEWEYAARAGMHTTWFFGDDPARLGDYAWFNENSGGKGQLHPVGQKKPNPWGLYDIYGNVWERVADAYDENYFANSPKEDPAGPGQDPQSRVAYTINVPRAGSYALTVRVVTMNYDQVMNVSVNDDGPVITVALPFTCGQWQDSEPVVLNLKQGESILNFSRTNAPQYGIAVKAFTLTPRR